MLMMSRRYYIVRGLALVAVAATTAMAWFVSAALGVPVYVGYQMTLFQQPSPAFALAIIVLLAFVGLKVATLIAAQREETGFVVALLGLGGVALRGGSVRSVYQANPSSGALLQLGCEMAIYTALAAAMWFAMRWWRGSRLAPASLARREPLTVISPLLAATSIVCQTVACFLLLYVLGRSDAPWQGLGAAATASAISVFAVRLMLPLPSPGPYWIAPLLAATAGYFANYFSSGGLEIAHPDGPWAPLARALPLHHLVAGPAAAVITYWYTQTMGLPERPTVVATPAA